MSLTAEQIEIVKELGFDVDENTTKEQLKGIMGEKFIDLELHKELLKKEGDTKYIQGFAKVENGLRKVLGSDAEGVKDVDKLIEAVATKISSFDTELKTLKANPKSKDADIEKLQKERDDMAEMFANLKKENEDLTLSLNNEKQNHINYKLNEKVSSDFESTKWTDETDNYKKIGLWNAEIQNKYTFKLEDEFVYDMEGNVVKDEKGTGKLTRRALFDRIAEKAGALKKNGATETATSKSKKPENLLPHEEAHFNMREQLKAKYAPKA